MVWAARTFFLEVVGDKFALVEGLQDGLASFVEVGELGEAVTDGGDLDFVEGAGLLFAVARDEGDGAAFF